MHRSLLCLVLVAIPLTAMAKDIASRAVPYSPSAALCVKGISTTATISINFNGQENSLAGARAAFDKQRIDMMAEAEKLGKGDIQLSNFYYNVNGNFNTGSTGPVYNFSGNLNYQMGSEEVAKRISERLAELKRNFSMNLNGNRCESPVDDGRAE